MSSKQFKASQIELTLLLPRVVSEPQGKVGHILTNATNIWASKSVVSPVVTDVACHRIDRYNRGRWATPNDPTCRNCLKAIRFVTKNQ